MKKSTAFLLSAVILLSCVFNAFAMNVANRVFADSVCVESGETVTIPVKIENNKGFMGFSIIVTYDDEIFTPISVPKGSMLSGMFNDSIETSTNNSFKVVYSGTADTTGDGILFNLKFDVADGYSGKFDIELSYSQQDTFNEKWANVELVCDAVQVVITENGTTVATTTTTVVYTTESTTKKETTTIPTTIPTTTKPVVEETTTEPATQSPEVSTTMPEITDPDVSTKLISEQIRDWADALAAPLSWFFKYPAYFIASIVSLFE